MSIEESLQRARFELPEEYRSKVLSNNTLMLGALDEYKTHFGKDHEPDEQVVEHVAVNLIMPYTYAALAASFMLSQVRKEGQVAFEPSPLTTVPNFHPNFELLIKEDDKLPSSSSDLRGFLFAALMSNMSSTEVVTLGSTHQALSLAETAALTGNTGRIYVTDSLDEDELGSNKNMSQVELVRSGKSTKAIEERFAGEINADPHNKDKVLFLHPAESLDMRIGNAAVITEIKEKDVDYLFIPPNSGSLLPKAALVAKEKYPNVQIFSPFLGRLTRRESLAVGDPVAVSQAMGRDHKRVYNRRTIEELAITEVELTLDEAKRGLDLHSLLTGRRLSLKGILAFAAVIKLSEELHGKVIAITTEGFPNP